MKTGISVIIKGMDVPAYVTPYLTEIDPKKEYYVRYQTAPGHGYIGKTIKGSQIQIKPQTK